MERIAFIDNLIALAVILFTFSLIHERVVNLLKTCIPALRNQTTETTKEKKRERNILVMNIVIGIMVAFLTGLDLIHLIKNLGSGDGVWILLNGDVQYAMGPLLGGLFISMGSKFWHDLADLLYQAKRLRQLAADGKLNEVPGSPIP